MLTNTTKTTQSHICFRCLCSGIWKQSAFQPTGLSSHHSRCWFFVVVVVWMCFACVFALCRSIVWNYNDIYSLHTRAVGMGSRYRYDSRMKYSPAIAHSFNALPSYRGATFRYPIHHHMETSASVCVFIINFQMSSLNAWRKCLSFVCMHPSETTVILSTCGGAFCFTHLGIEASERINSDGTHNCG